MTVLVASLEDEVIITPQFRGPPNSGNGGYVCGLLASRLPGSTMTAVLRAPIPIDTPLRIAVEAGVARLTSLGGDLIAEGRAADPSDLPTPPAPPSLEAATVAGRGFFGLARTFHPVCFTCATDLEEGYGLRVFVGQLAGADEGVVAGPWTPHANFRGADGLISHEAVWGALDCPGSVAWVEKGGSGGLLGTMTCEIRRRPAAGEACVVVAWPIERGGRKSIAGTALFSARGELLARSRQIWIGRVVA